MKLFTGYYQNELLLGVLKAEETGCILLRDIGIEYETMHDFISKHTQEELASIKEATEPIIDVEEIRFQAPIPHPRQDIICLGINYLAHAEESARFHKESFERERAYPVYFSKRVNAALGDKDSIVYNKEMYEQLDYEVELAVIIGKDAKNVKREEALDYIFGYTIMNDMSARDIQLRHKQWYFGKSMDGFTPMGPVITTVDEFDGIPNLKITSKVNGEIRQNSETKLQQFDIAYVIEELSRGFTLQAGTIIATGTPAGVGMGFDPPRFLEIGDIVECEIEKIGVLRNKITEND
ncbi:MAG: fumarylacetoacetate hydrolase family protein [Eubacteriales bacterium]